MLQLRGTTLGAGKLSLIIPIAPAIGEELVEMATEAVKYSPDMVEWRLDYFHDVENDAVPLEELKKLREILGETPLMITVRHHQENGVKELDPTKKMGLLQSMMETALVDVVDVELRYGPEYLSKIRACAHAHGASLVISYHDTQETPTADEMVRKLKTEFEWGADICKVSFAAQSYKDMTRLASSVAHAREQGVSVPVIAIAAGQIGEISRIAADLLGSDATFVSCGITGQIHIEDLREWRDLLHIERGGQG